MKSLVGLELPFPWGGCPGGRAGRDFWKPPAWVPETRPGFTDGKGRDIPWGRGFTLAAGDPQVSPNTHSMGDTRVPLGFTGNPHGPSQQPAVPGDPSSFTERHGERQLPLCALTAPQPAGTATPRPGGTTPAGSARASRGAAVGDRPPPQEPSRERWEDRSLARGSGGLRDGRLSGRAPWSSCGRWGPRGRAAGAGAARAGHGRRRLPGYRQGWRGRRRRGGGSVSSLRPGRKEALGGHRVWGEPGRACWRGSAPEGNGSGDGASWWLLGGREALRSGGGPGARALPLRAEPPPGPVTG